MTSEISPKRRLGLAGTFAEKDVEEPLCDEEQPDAILLRGLCTFCLDTLQQRGQKSCTKNLSEPGGASCKRGDVRLNEFSTNARAKSCSITRPSSDNLSSLPSSTVFAPFGVRGFFAGLVPCILRAFPANACAMYAYEGLMRTFGAEKVSNMVVALVRQRLTS